MTVKEAKKIRDGFEAISIPTEEDVFMFTEAMDFLISKEHNPNDMLYLGGYFYEEHKFDLALKYYEMAAAYDVDGAYECLGYIWYYGRTGERDYEKAFYYFSKLADKGNIVASYKIADMYRNGYGVEKDQEKYESIIENLVPEVRDARYLNEPKPEVFTRYAKILSDRGEPEKAISMYLSAKDFLAQRIKYNPFWGNLNIMNWLIQDMYSLMDFDPDIADFYDLWYVLRSPCEITFSYRNKDYKIKAEKEEEGTAVGFDGKWFRSADDFYRDAAIGKTKLTGIYDELEILEVRTDG